METRPMKLWSILPWLGGAVLLGGAAMAPATAPMYYRSILLVIVLLATGGTIAAAGKFERGDLLFTTWSVLAAGYIILAVRYAMRLAVTMHAMGQIPVMFDRVLLILHNVAVPLALWLFVRAWRVTGLAGPMSSGANAGWTLAGFVVAIAIGAWPVVQGLHATDPSVLVSTLGDMISIALIVPLLIPALGMRGGLLMYTWLYLALAQVVWLMYDIWSFARPRTGMNNVWGMAIDQALRGVAILYVFSAAAAQRRAIARTDEPTLRRKQAQATAPA